MKKYFKYRDGSTELISDVLAGNSEKSFLYAPMSYYRAIARERVWDGMPHVTDLFNGARMQLFKHIMDTAVDVDGAVWSITGLTGHRSLELASGEEEAGKTWRAFGIQGTNDHVEEFLGKRYIIDSKFYGSYAVASKIGVYEAGRRQVVGKDGKIECYQKSGKWGKVGDPKTEPVYKYDVEKGESFDLVMQLNIYKVIGEESGEKPFDGLRAFIVPRDGGTVSARQRGVFYNTYMIQLPVREKQLVVDFTEARRDAIKAAMSLVPLFDYVSGHPAALAEHIKTRDIKIPGPCSARECWDGRRCQGYCEVADLCKRIGDVPYLTSTEEESALAEF